MNKNKPQLIRKIDGWYTVSLPGGWLAQAQVFGLPSQFGIGARDTDGNWICDPANMPDSARISRLTITDDPHDWSHKQAVYNYDRGLDYDNAPDGLPQLAIEAILSFA